MPPEIEGFFRELSAYQVILWAAFVGGALYAMWKGFPWLRKFVAFINDVTGEPARAGVPARPGLMERLATVEDTVAIVKHEVMPNTGTSLRDVGDRTEQAVTILQSAMDDVHTKLDNDNQRITGLSGQLEEHITQSSQIINKLSKEKS